MLHNVKAMDSRSRIVKRGIEEGEITDLFGVFELITKTAFAKSIGVSKPRLNRMCNEPLSITWADTFNIATALHIDKESSIKLIANMIGKAEPQKSAKQTPKPGSKPKRAKK